MFSTRKLARKFLPVGEVSAHCDIPCGIYDPHLAQIGALTTIRMNQLIKNLEKPDPHASAEEREVYSAKLSRYIATKEEHAELVKRELRILWGDYFKAEHVQQFPNLHDLFFTALKTASKVRQEVNAAAADQLLAEVNEIADVFWKTKGVTAAKKPSNQAVGGEIVVPA